MKLLILAWHNFGHTVSPNKGHEESLRKKKKKNPFLETTSYGGLSMTPKDICKILVQRWKYG